MSEAVLEWRNYRYFPYERDFARLEVERLFGASSRECSSGLRIPSAMFRPESADRLTYFARAVPPDGPAVVPRQVRLEASAHVEERERQATRYSAHGLHEYKGKFNPQVVRAIGNILGLDDGAWVLDPFCGSGTALLECAHVGWNAVGIDRNPLAVRIANAKVRALRHANGTLQEMAANVVAGVRRLAGPLSSSRSITRETIDRALGPEWIRELPSMEYLLAWFPLAVLAQVAAIRRVLHTCASRTKDRAVFEVVLSDQLRSVSLQEPADLRIRRRKKPQPNYPLADLYATALRERIERIERARIALGTVQGEQRALLDDIRNIRLEKSRNLPSGGFDAVVTSPPYETALPYIDTHRLSLVLLGDIQAGEVHETEKALIGAREIGTRERKELEEAIETVDHDLPGVVGDLCQELLIAARMPANGFRRRNRPALVYRYFKSMAAFFANVRGFLKPGGKVALVVGTNRTVLGGREYEIDTPRLLLAVAEHFGYARIEERPMDTYPRYDLHQRNSIGAEMLIVLSAPTIHRFTMAVTTPAAASKPRHRQSHLPRPHGRTAPGTARK